MAGNLRLTKFKDVDLSDSFFDSLKKQYIGFEDWFASKANEPAYVVDDPDIGGLRGFVYLKIEEGAIDDVQPVLPPAKRIKVGTFKIIAHGTKLGERVIKKIFDHAVGAGAKEIYVTVFDTHNSLIKLFKKYGFVEHGKKTTKNGTELVLLRSLETMNGDILKDYPRVKCGGKKKWLLAIYPEHHTKLFPDSILNTEHPNIIEDVSHTNAIHKAYVAKLFLTRMKKGDVVVIYRTTDVAGRARFRSVVTSVCVVEETKSRKDFRNADDFINYTLPHSVFSEDELRQWYDGDDRLYVVRMMYNAAFRKRTIRGTLLDEVRISEHPRWDLRELTNEQFAQIMQLGQVNEGIIVD
ncbi:GNAT family N-acetyltransferase [Azospirillum melinis]|uniref:GNAT family N-acetyltransferase n=1 Tax=Azospirillum melinis TaxID=328839 RepID=UPI00375687F7